MIQVLRSALGIASRRFVEANLKPPNSALKASGIRDVVTDLDLSIDSALSSYFLEKNIPFLSEETLGYTAVSRPRYAIFDPLDGSLNYLCSIPFYGTIIAIIENNCLVCGGIASHSDGITVYGDNARLIFSRRYKAPSLRETHVPPCFLAYGPSLSPHSQNLINSLFCADPKVFPGFHRLGSTAHGALQFISGRYSAFVCLDVRIWDVAGILSILSTLSSCKTYVHVSPGRISVLCYNNSLSYRNLLDSFVEGSSDFSAFKPSSFGALIGSYL